MTFPRGRWLAVVSGFVVCLAARDVLAQGSPILPETRSVRLGPFTVYPTIALRDAGMDSNVYNDSTGPKGDFTYSATPRFFVAAPFANTRFVGRGLGSLTYYRTYKDQQAISGLFDARYEVVSPGFRPFVSAGFADRRERRGYEIDARLRQRQAMASAGLDVDLTAITALTAWATRTSTNWDRNAEYLGVLLAEQLDHLKDTVAAGARFRVTPLTSVVGFAEIQKDRFERSPIRDSDGFRIGSTVDFESTAAISGHLTAAYRSFKPLNNSFAGFGGLSASAELRYKFLDWTEVELDADRDIDYSYDTVQPFLLENGGRLEITQRLIGPLAIVAVGERRTISHQLVGQQGFNGRHELTRSAGGGVAIQFRKQIRFEVIYERLSRTSSQSQSRAFERQRLMASAIYGQ